MYFLREYEKKTIKKDLLNKFNYKNTKKIPELKKITLNFGHNSTDLKKIASHLLALELITNQRGVVNKTKTANIRLKIRQDQPVGSKVVLLKTNKLKFVHKLINEILPKLKNFNGLIANKNITNNTFSYRIYDTFNFLELEKHYHLFNNLSKLDISLSTTSSTIKETEFLLKSLQIILSSK